MLSIFLFAERKSSPGRTSRAMKRMSEIDELDRPREKIAARGPAALTDRELIAAILGRGTKGRDVSVISGEVAALFSEGAKEVTYQNLARIRGMGPAGASQIVAALEISRRYLAGREEPRVKVTAPADVLPLVREFVGKKQEHFVCITLNGANEVIATRIITVGLLNHSLVHPREVYSDAIADRAAAIICVHNHPSGTLEPSREDQNVTRQLVQAGDILGIRLLDHLVVAEGGYVSLRERGMM